MFNQFQIIVNNQQIQLGNELPDDIYQLSVTLSPMMPVQIPHNQTPLVKQWLNNIIKRLSCNYVDYNKTLIPTNELQKFKL